MPTGEMSFEIAGKRVALKRRLPLRDGHQLPALLQACQDGDLRSQVAVMVRVIESWGFAGDPADAAAYDDLDVYSEILPLAKAVAEHLQERLGQSPKA